MGKETGQMQEETQQLLDEYNELYNWEYNDMVDFIVKYGEQAFRDNYDDLIITCYLGKFISNNTWTL